MDKENHDNSLPSSALAWRKRRDSCHSYKPAYGLSLSAGVLEDAGITASDLERAATYYKGLAEGGGEDR